MHLQISQDQTVIHLKEKNGGIMKYFPTNKSFPGFKSIIFDCEVLSPLVSENLAIELHGLKW